MLSCNVLQCFTKQRITNKNIIHQEKKPSLPFCVYFSCKNLTKWKSNILSNSSSSHLHPVFLLLKLLWPVKTKRKMSDCHCNPKAHWKLFLLWFFPRWISNISELVPAKPDAVLWLTARPQREKKNFNCFHGSLSQINPLKSAELATLWPHAYHACPNPNVLNDSFITD